MTAALTSQFTITGHLSTLLNTPSRLLLLGYKGGIQAWDCAHEQAREILSLLLLTIGVAVIEAAIIPARVSSQDHLFSEEHIRATNSSSLISTVAPPALHILNSTTFDHLSTVPAPHVALPIFALSRRVLAYASTPPPPSTSPIPTPSTASPSKVQAHISMAIEGARKVGVGVWSGVKSLLKESNAPRVLSPYSPVVRSPSSMSPPTLASARQAPRRIVQHHATPGQAVGVLAFSRTGNLLAVTGADGIFARIFEVRPKGRYSKGGPCLTKRDELNELEERDTGSLWHWYDLQRGLTRRRITNIVRSADSKWIAVVTVRGTLPIFAINPGLPVTVTFGRPSKPDRESGAQDIFVLNRATGELMLKQCVVRTQSAPAIECSMKARMSLPSALSNGVAGAGVSALSIMMRGGVGAVVGERDDLVLGGAEALGMTWGSVKREREWGEVRKVVEWTGVEERASKRTKSSKSEWLAQAEILTCTRSLKLLSGPIYLSHHFAFFSLDRDWETPLGMFHFNLPATKITVRREVSARPIADSGSEGAFLGSGTDDMFAASSSLDKTLHTAITGSLSPASKTKQVPSFPNAYSGGKGTSWNDPVRRLSRLSDGLGQGLGSLKREIGKVRPSSGSGERRVQSHKAPSPAVEATLRTKLEFDDNALFEIDEDLPNIDEPVEGDGIDEPVVGGGLRPSRDPGIAGDCPGDGDSFGEEDEEYIQARAEDDRFHDLVVGLIDEEEEAPRVVMESATSMMKKHKKC
ncbi:unnamed protein product [Rhizoctonia solani]|uniref:BCAS3 WD40 domain-containing protein n=1 Tax=Rhizoctonia solani TaxID=456999 RepID=A0A8H2WBC2_9AGAM|nr:unnamed protein product [Rhizoctonia solani]